MPLSIGLGDGNEYKCEKPCAHVSVRSIDQSVVFFFSTHHSYSGMFSKFFLIFALSFDH